MVAVKDLTSQKKKKGFHAKYLAICKSKNIQPLPEVKTKQKNIHVVDFHADRVRVYDWISICGALEHDSTLKILSIKLRKNDEMVFEDIDNLKKTKSLISHPVIYSKFILMDLLNALQSMLSINAQLEVLILEGMPIYGRYMTHLTKGLCSNRSLKIINFARSKIGDEACEILCSNIKHLANIESVNLSQCNLSFRGAESVRDFIRFQKIHRFSEAWIRSLRYQNVDTSLFDGVKKIYLNNNPKIGDEGLQILTDELKEDVWIKEIELQNCGLTSDGASHIMNCLQINKTILNFNVNNNSEIPDHLQRQIMVQLGGGCDGESSDSSETRSVQHRITKSQLIDNVKFLEDQLESETFQRKELEKLNDQLHNQINEVKREMSNQGSMVNIPEGYTLVENEELQKIMVKKSSVVTHRSYSNAAVKLRRKKKSTNIKNVRSYVIEQPHTSQALATSKSENILKIDMSQKVFVERKIGDSLDIGGGCDIEENSMMGIDLLRCFVKRKTTTRHFNQTNNDLDPRVFFTRKPSQIVPSNSDVDTDE